MSKNKFQVDTGTCDFCCSIFNGHFTQLYPGVSFYSKATLEGHELSDCGRSPSFECDLCGKFLATKSTLTKHMMIHTDERNFPCQFCSKKFRDQIRVRTHTRYRHSGERPHKCPFCEKCFVDLSSMKVHTIVHTGIKRYVCYGCGERYPTNSALHKHRNARKTTCALVPIKPPSENKDWITWNELFCKSEVNWDKNDADSFVKMNLFYEMNKPFRYLNPNEILLGFNSAKTFWNHFNRLVHNNQHLNGKE